MQKQHRYAAAGAAFSIAIHVGSGAALAQAAVPQPVEAGDLSQSVIVIEHPTRVATLSRNGAAGIDTLQHEGEVRLGGNRRAAVRISGTNSALYQCSVTQTSTPVPEVQQIQRFLTALTPYPTDLISTIESAGFVPSGPARRDTASLRDDLEEAAAVAGYWLAGVRRSLADANRLRAETLLTLERMRSPAHPVEDLSGNLRQAAGCADDTCKNLQVAETTVGAVTNLLPASERFRALLALSQDSTPQQKRLAAELQTVAEDFDAIIASVYATERLFRTTSTARSTIDCDSVRVSWSRGRDLVVKVTPRAMPEIQRVAEREPLEFKTKALPRFQVTPAVGVGLLFAPGARYPKFATVKAPGDSVDIVRSGTGQDSRTSYGLTLGARLPGVLGGPLSLHLPEVTINPSSDSRAIGVGGAVSVAFVKVGVGALWTRHTELDGQEVGDRLRDAALLQTSNTYSSPNWYVSLAVTGWPSLDAVK